MNRISGLDLARFFAFIGMALVNFNMVMAYTGAPSPIWMSIFEGKAAATFVTLAGLGLGLAARKYWGQEFVITILKRALFLMVIGFLNVTMFTADIIHYYAFYFLIAIWLAPLRTSTLLAITGGLILAFPALFALIEYNQNWDWELLEYIDLWQPQNFLMNLFYNGWHPIIPWLGFFTFGMFLSKLELGQPKTAQKLTAIGTLGLIALPFVSQLAMPLASNFAGASDFNLLSTSPIPPGPIYMLTGISAAMFLIGLCLLLPKAFRQTKLAKALSATGTHTLTHYFAHIFIGMGIIEEFGWLGTASPEMVLVFTVSYVLVAVMFSYLWANRFKRGPLETVMRRVCG